jgi:hypothetical protein
MSYQMTARCILLPWLKAIALLIDTLKPLADGGKLVSRSIQDHQAIFNQLGMSIRYDVKGKMAFIYCSPNTK